MTYQTPWDEFFESRTRQFGDCIVWTGYINNRGYGATTVDGSGALAHRISLEIATGVKLASGIQVDHSCFNHACVNPNHLSAATAFENQQRRKGANKNSSTGYRNVYQETGSLTWYVQVIHNSEKHRLSGFRSPEEANEAAIGLRKELA